MLTTSKRWKDFRQHARRPNPATVGLAQAVNDAKLDPTLIDLLDLLTAYINGCAFYPEYRRYVTLRGEVNAAKLDALERGRDALSGSEGAALAWADALADAMRAACGTAAFQEMRSRFSLEQAAFLSAAIAAMNVWNRGGMGFQYAPLRAD